MVLWDRAKRELVTDNICINSKILESFCRRLTLEIVNKFEGLFKNNSPIDRYSSSQKVLDVTNSEQENYR